jgi:hypothetical protein
MAQSVSQSKRIEILIASSQRSADLHNRHPPPQAEGLTVNSRGVEERAKRATTPPVTTTKATSTPKGLS